MDSVTQGQRLFTARLVIGLALGIALYLLYSAYDAKIWPATIGLAFAPLLMVSLAIPTLLISALGEMPERRALTWAGIALIAVAVLAAFDNWSAWPLDWGYGTDGPRPHVIPSPQLFVFGAAGLFIAHVLVTGASIDRRLQATYPTHFDVAWKMAVQVALSGAFVGAFWMLLWLGAGLFALIKLNFFRDLIQHRWFAIPVTAMAAAGALHLTDIRPALVRGARTLALTLLSWLLPLITLIVTGFLASLPFTGLSALWSFGHASALLLMAAAALIVLINAAYQDGDAERRPPKILRQSANLAAILPLPLSLIAAYALILRVSQYGWTIERIWLAASVLMAVGYAGGYALAAIQREPWLARIERWNFVMSLAALAILVALFTPIASPARIAVADQMARLANGKVTAAKFDFAYLRRSGGHYGQVALAELAASKDAFTAKAAKFALRETARYASLPSTTPSFVANLTVYPRGAKLPDSFARMDWNKENRVWLRPNCPGAGPCDAIVADLDGDGRPEVSILGNAPTFAQVFREDPAGVWRQAGSFQMAYQCPALLEALRAGNFQTHPPPLRWNEIQVGTMTLHVREMNDLEAPPVCAK